MEGMRNLSVLVKQIKDLIPHDADHHVQHLRLIWWLDHLSYQPPEMQYENFMRFATEFIEPVIGEPPITEDWKIKIVALWMMISEDEVKKQFGVKI